MCDDLRALSFENLLTDPLIRLVMKSDGVTHSDMVAVLEVARAAAMARRLAAQPQGDALYH